MPFRLAAIVILLLGFCNLQAQSLDSLLDLPSVINVSDSLKNFSVNQKSLHTLDSIQTAASHSLNKLKLSYDSVKTTTERELRRIQSRIDSLINFNLPANKLTHKLDSIARWKDEKLNAIQSKVDGLKGKVAEKIQSLQLPDELKDKTSELTSLIDNLDVSMPDATFPQLSLGDKLSLDMNGIDDVLSGGALPDLNNSLPGNLPNAADVKLPTEDLSSISDQIRPYHDKITEVVPDNINDVPSIVEKEAVEAVQLDDVQKQIGEAGQLSEMTSQLNNQEAVKEKLKEVAQQQAMDHFAGKEQQLEQAMETLAKYKKKYESVQSLADLPKKLPNPMHDKPFIERLIPGIAIQIHREDAWLFDFNPYFGYRISGKLTAGIGWNQRIAYNFDEMEFQARQKIFGPRTYGEFLVAKGFSARLELEYMKTDVPSQFSSGHTDEQGREWVFSTMAGLKKDYTFLKSVKGTVMLLYNLYDPHHRSPYGEKLNMRFGFEFPIKK